MHPRYDRYDLDEGLVTMGEQRSTLTAQAYGGHDAVVRAQQRRFGRTRSLFHGQGGSTKNIPLHIETFEVFF